MQWEYIQVLINGDSTAHDGVIVLDGSGTRKLRPLLDNESTNADIMVCLLNQLGDAQWELVGSIQYPYQVILYFKRPRLNTPA